MTGAGRCLREHAMKRALISDHWFLKASGGDAGFEAVDLPHDGSIALARSAATCEVDRRIMPAFS